MILYRYINPTNQLLEGFIVFFPINKYKYLLLGQDNPSSPHENQQNV